MWDNRQEFRYRHHGPQTWEVWQCVGGQLQNRVCDVWSEAQAQQMCALLSRVTRDQYNAALSDRSDRAYVRPAFEGEAA